MSDRIVRFFQGIDESWTWPHDEKIPLRIIGSTALMLQVNYERGTKDSDVLETNELGQQTQERLIQLAGKDTKVFRAHRLYIDFVASGIPFLPHPPDYHLLPLSLTHFELRVLDVVDVVISKLKRFSPNDLSDIRAMVEGDHVPHSILIKRFESAVDFFAGDARSEDLPKYIENLNQVERDLFGVEETVIDVPSWI